MNNIKEKLKDNKTVIGTWVNSASPIISEIMAQQELDFVCIDAEHSPVDINNIFSLFQGITSGNSKCAPAVRIHGSDYSLTKRYMDLGAELIIAPLINNSEEAKIFIDAVKYPPIGKRGLGFCRGNRYGENVLEYYNNINNSIVTAIQIEDISAIDNLDNILELGNIDVVFIGPFDLSASMGIPGDFENKGFINAKDRILQACKKHDVCAGIHVVNPDSDEVIERISEGYKMIAFSLDITIISNVIKENMSKINKYLTQYA